MPAARCLKSKIYHYENRDLEVYPAVGDQYSDGDCYHARSDELYGCVSLLQCYSKKSPYSLAVIGRLLF